MSDTVQVPYLDFAFQHNPLQDEITQAFKSIMDRGHFVLGEEVANFERDFAEYCDVRHAIAVNSGTSAVHLALIAAGVTKDDEVITTPSTFVATIAAITYFGARPVLVDINPNSFCIDPVEIEAAITPRTKAIVPVHLYGAPAEMDVIMEVAKNHGLAVIEDAAQAHGARYQDRRVGGLGIASAFSFYPGKNLGAFGEGGAVVTNSDEIADKVRLLRSWGEAGKGNHEIPAFNYRMDAIQGAVLGIKLRQLDSWNTERRRIADSYRKGLVGVPLTFQAIQADSEPVYHVMAVTLVERQALKSWMEERGIQIGIHYPTPVHLSPAYRYLGYQPGDFPNSEFLSRSELSLPIYPGLSSQKIDLVVQTIVEFFTDQALR
jgi:dTDP-4-amino-4,6-dideoxygalactose transaminase